MVDNNGGGCQHLDAVLSPELGTFRCPHCGFIKKLDPRAMQRMQLVQETFPWIQQWDELLSKFDWQGDEREMVSLLAYATCGLRDFYKRPLPQIIDAVTSFHVLCRFRYTEREGGDHGGN